MTSALYLERRWLMDTFGCFLQYDSMSQKLMATAFTSQSFPNLFTFIPVPEKFPHRAILRLTNSIPSAIPPARFIRLGTDEVAIQNIETGFFLSSSSEEKYTNWLKTSDHGTRFMLLSKEMLIGLSLLSDPDMARISMGDEELPHLTFSGTEKGAQNLAQIGDLKIKIAENLNEIAKISGCTPAEGITISLKSYSKETDKIALTVLPKRALQLSSF